MSYSKKKIALAGLIASLASSLAYAGADLSPRAPGEELSATNGAPMPRTPQTLPPSAEQQAYNLAPTTKPRLDLMSAQQRRSTLSKTSSVKTPECVDMSLLATYSGSALADYVANLVDYECGYGLFQLDSTAAAVIFTEANFLAVAQRFALEAGTYDASNIVLNNLLVYLRAGYYLASYQKVAFPSNAVRDVLRTGIQPLVDGTVLFKDNPNTPNTAAETLKLITNMFDEAHFLPSVRNIITRYTNSSVRPHASYALREATASRGFTGALTVFFYAQFRNESRTIEAADPSYARALYKFVRDNKKDLIDTGDAFQLNDTENEAFRFMQYPSLNATVKAEIKATLATTSLTGNDMGMWLNAAAAADFYDSGKCADYGTCGYTTKLTDIVLKDRYTCSPTIKIRAQDMSPEKMAWACATVGAEETYFHKMMKTNNTPVADDYNSALEINIFHDYTQYSKYAGIIFGISTNNGGMSLEGNPADPNNQARFIAHEASWLRPEFSVWNLKHEYIHYLDSRFDMYGDFGMAISKPSVWYIEGLAEYLSRENDDQEAIDLVQAGNPVYPLSTVFNNDYSMNDYQNRAYRWGYMATRFMFEKHRSDVDTILAKFRVGDYTGYWNYMTALGTQYDAEFATWTAAATTAGCPTLPGLEGQACPVPVEIPPVAIQVTPCNSSNQLNKYCWVDVDLAAGQNASAVINLPAGAKNLRLWTEGGTGDVDMYVNFNTWPTIGGANTATSITPGTNEESVTIATPVTNNWYYIYVKANTASAGVKLHASWD